MSAVLHMTVASDETDLRLDRWFRRHFPGIAHGRLQKLLRTGQVRVDGRRVKGDLRLEVGQTVRVPPIGESAPAPEAKPSPPEARAGDADLLRSMIVHEDDRLLVLDKPPGLAVQGGTGTTRHIDGLLRSLDGEGGERMRLVHRLDRDTSGILLVAKTAASAAELTAAFRRHEVDKLYWAIVVGRPDIPAGTIDLSLGKQAGRRGERMGPDDEEGRRARTVYRTIARAGKVATWLALKPLTGRTHQLRVHCAAIGTPILGDGKYGAQAARLAGAPRGLMLHAREIGLPMPDGRILRVTAPLPEPMREAFAFLGFESDRSLPGARLETFGEP
jgi:23S rRNA pseudouridine955/2504/2580 synthase